MKTFARILDRCISVVTFFIGVVLILYSAYVLYDSFVISQSAFSSEDLLQYKPLLDPEDDSPGFQELMEINPDVVGWLTIYDTNIDYPVLQGKDNMEYINKNVYGEFSLSGSIYLAAENESTFTDDYNLVYGHNFFGDGYSLIYGHNITGGAMFGDIPKFLEEDFFRTHRGGLLQTPDGENYDLTVFACVRTDAYESRVYSMNNRDQSEDPELLSYIRENAVVYDLPEGVRIDKLIALSTCAITETNGRVVLFAYATEHEGEIVEESGTEPKETVRRVAVGHGQEQGKWALLNLICVILTVLTLFPLGWLRKKYHYVKRSKWIGILLEALLSIGAILLFYFTENMRVMLGMIDRWTPVMILIFAVALVIDVICFRRVQEKEEQEDEGEDERIR